MTRDVAWARSGLAVGVRELILSGVFRPLIAMWTKREVIGHEHLDGLAGPVVFVANHASHMDTPLVLRALPWRWRRRTGVAAAADYFYESAPLAHTVSLAFSTVPVERRGEGDGNGTSALDTLLGKGWSLVVYAEGTRSRDGVVGRLRTGAAVLAAEHGLPIVPVHIAGTHATMPVGRGWMRRGPRFSRRPVRVTFGRPLEVGEGDDRTEVMDRVRRFLESQGAETTPPKRSAAARA